MANTPNLELPEVPEAIQGAADEINAGFWRLDAVVQLAVLDNDLTIAGLPASAVQGDRYIIASGPRVGHVAFRSPVGWLYYVPRPGWRARVLDEDEDYIYNGTDWVIDPAFDPGALVPVVKQYGAQWSRPSGEDIEVPVGDVLVTVTRACEITKNRVLTQGVAGDCVIDVQRDSYANFPPTSPDSITASAKPTVTAGIKSEDSTLTGWSTALAAGDVLRFKLESATGFTDVQITLECEET